MPLPWDRQAGETTKQYDAFCEYRDMGISRSLVKLKDRLEKKYKRQVGAGYDKMLGRWSSRNHWVARVKSYDTYIEEDRRLRLEKVRADATEQEVLAIKNALAALASRFNEITRNNEWSDMEPADVLKELRETIKLERTVLGMATEISKQETTSTIRIGDVSAESTADLIKDPVISELICSLLDKQEMGTTELRVKKNDVKPPLKAEEKKE